MKKINFLILIFFAFTLFSAEFIVRDFQECPRDIELQRNPVKDVNSEFAALIKISTDLIPFSFNTNIGVVDTKKKVGEFWAYVQSGTSQLIFSKEGFSKLRYPVPITIKSNTVYSMKLRSWSVADENLIQITFDLNENDVYISKDGSTPIQQKKKIVDYSLPKGEHKFKFFKQGFNEIIRTINIQKEETFSILMQPGATEEKMILSGYIVISSEPEGAEIFINDQRMGVTPIAIELTAGEHILTIRKTFFNVYTGNFKLKAGETKTLESIILKPKFGYFTVESSPTNASIFLDDKLIGKAPISKRQIESGLHKLSATMDLYHPETREFEIKDGADSTFVLSLKPAFGELIINSQPEDGADVFIYNEKVGITPYKNERMPSGQYHVRVEKEFWLGSEDMVVVNDTLVTNKTLRLTKNFANLIVKAQDSRIYLNEEYVGNNEFSQKLQKGNHRIKASKENHRDHEQEIYITPGEDIEVELNPIPIFASLSIQSTPFDSRGANIFLNGQEQDQKSPAVFEVLIGKYEVTLKHPDFLDNTQLVELKEHEQKKLEFLLQTYEGSMLARADKWKKRKWISLLSSSLFAGAGYFCNYLGDDYYSKYENSSSTADAISNRENFRKWDNYRDYSYYISVGPAVWSLYSWIKQIHYEKKVAKTN